MKGFPVSKLGQARGSEACLGDPGRGRLASLLYFSPSPSPCPRLLKWQKPEEAAWPSCRAASWVHPPGALPFYG